MRRWEFFQFANRLKLANRWLQILLILSLILGINQLALKHFVRVDLTETHRYALSPETKAYLQDMQDPVRIVVTIPSDSPRQEEQVLFRYVDQLLKEYAYQSRHRGEFLITVEYVDIYKDLARADALARDYGLDQVNSVLVLSKNRKRLIRADEMITFSNRKAVSFTGEAALTSAVIEVTQEKSLKLYFLIGHQETTPEDPSPQSGLSRISRELQMRNLTIQPLDLTATAEVPADAAVLIMADPKGGLLPSEVDKIRTYLLDRAGRVIAWIRPGVDSGLGSLFPEWGLHLPDQVVIESDPAFRDTSGALLIRNLGEHQITASLIENQTFITSGTARPVIPRPPVPPDERLHVVPLFATSSGSWAEAGFGLAEDPVFNRGVDLPGPVPIAAATERRASSQLGIKVPGGRMVVFGAADLFSNQRVASLGNITLFLNTLNWMLDRDRMLVIPPRPVESYQFSFSQNQLKNIGFLFLTVPGAIALCGFLVYWIRQS